MYEEVKRILNEYACVDDNLISPSSNLQTDLNLNSLDIVNVIVEFEETFGIEINEEDIRTLSTVDDIVKYIESHTHIEPAGVHA